MSEDEIDLGEAHLLEHPLHTCPKCDSAKLVPVRDGNDVNFLCLECSRCWHVELGRVWRVDPGTCERCEHFGRCAKVFATDHQQGESAAHPPVRPVRE